MPTPVYRTCRDARILHPRRPALGDHVELVAMVVSRRGGFEPAQFYGRLARIHTDEHGLRFVVFETSWDTSAWHDGNVTLLPLSVLTEPPTSIASSERGR